MTLISKEKFIEDFNLYLNQSTLGEISPFRTRISIGEMCSLIDKQPVAYNADKSIEQISNLLAHKFRLVYCDYCKNWHEENDECDDCHRKNMHWSLDKNEATVLATKIMKLIFE